MNFANRPVTKLQIGAASSRDTHSLVRRTNPIRPYSWFSALVRRGLE